MALTPEPDDERKRYRSRLGAAVLVAGLAVGGVAFVAGPNEIERAMSEGCDALPLMAGAYDSGDRATFDEVNDQAMRLGFAEFRGPDLTDDQSLIHDAAVASNAYFTLYDAAYEPAESNNGKSVWRGQSLTPSQREAVAGGLSVCEDY